MKVLLDHCVPRRFARVLAGHEVNTAASQGWAGLRNGELLGEAAKRFDALVTTDKGMRRQQNAATIPLPVILLVAVNSRFETLAPSAPAVLKLLDQNLERRIYVVESPPIQRGRRP